MSPDPISDRRSVPEGGALALGWARQRRLLVTVALLVVAALALGYVVQTLQTVLTPVFVAWVIAYALDPLIDRLEGRGVSRTLAIIIVLTVLTAAAVGFAFLIVPELIHQVVVFTARLPEKFEAARAAISGWVTTTFKVQVPETFDEVVRKFGDQLKNFFPRALGGATSIVQLVFTSTFTALAAFANLVLIPLFSFYLLQNFDRHIAQIRRTIPRRLRPRVEHIVRDIDRTMAGFFRGQITVMLIQSTLYSIGLSLLGVPLGAAIGILTGLLCFIPYLGQFTGLTLALLMCLLDYQSGMQILGVVALYGTVNVLDGLLITPRVVGGQVGLPPVGVIFALLVFGKLLGFIGVLLAVPFAAILKILLKHGLEYYKTTDFFLRGGEGMDSGVFARPRASSESGSAEAAAVAASTSTSTTTTDSPSPSPSASASASAEPPVGDSAASPDPSAKP